jgi:hypothetical protein
MGWNGVSNEMQSAGWGTDHYTNCSTKKLRPANTKRLARAVQINEKKESVPNPVLRKTPVK